MHDPIAVYVHVPFCPSKCGYCDFNSYAMNGPIVSRTVDAMVREILDSPHRGRPARTIFFGGGTPTFLEASDLERILNAVLEVHPPLDGIEITSEANPGTVDATKFLAMVRSGFNRVSLGAQSFLDTDLIALGRAHRAGEIERAVMAAREAGFQNINLDLMFALPGQSSRGWKDNLKRAFDIRPEHLSLYCLTIEPNTAFYRQERRGELVLPDDETQVEMYNECRDRAFEAGYIQYEISNFCLPGRECQHNLVYWQAEEYAGYGPGAVGRVGKIRATKIKHPERYCVAVESAEKLTFDDEILDDSTQRMEQIMLGLRLNRGLETQGLSLDPKGLRMLSERKWIHFDEGRIRLTAEGQHFCSEVALALI